MTTKLADFEAGRLQGLEEAAKIAEAEMPNWGVVGSNALLTLVEAIREKIKVGAQEENTRQ